MTVLQTETVFISSWDVAKQWRAIAGEFTATMLLLFTGCLSCIPIEGPPAVNALYASIAFGLVVLIMFQSFFHVSGAYMNPFIAIMAVIWKNISVQMGVVFIIAECAGAVAGYGLLVLISPVDVAGEGICVSKPAPNMNEWQALGLEIMLTAILALINCSAFDPINRSKSESLPLKFGFTLVALGLAASTITVPGMNPARSLGPAVWSNQWDSHWVYWVGPLVGGIVPTVFYKLVWYQPTEDLKLMR